MCRTAIRSGQLKIIKFNKILRELVFSCGEHTGSLVNFELMIVPNAPTMVEIDYGYYNFMYK